MSRRLRALRNQEGFSLIELLVVIAILGILASVVILATSGFTDKGKKSACRSDVATVQTASEAYYAKNNAYAANMAALVSGGFLRSVPGTSNYTINYSAASGSVTSTPGCDTL